MKLSQRLLPYGCAIALVSLLASFASAAQISDPVADGVAQIPDGSGRITLKGNVHPLARAEYDRGAVPVTLTLLVATGPSGGPVAAIKRGLRAAVVPISRRTICNNFAIIRERLAQHWRSNQTCEIVLE